MIKRLIKFLFPKVYMEIKDEGVNEYLYNYSEHCFQHYAEDDYNDIEWDWDSEKEYYENPEKEELVIPTAPFKEGDKVHLRTRNRIYTIVSSEVFMSVITCNKWQQEFNRNERNTPNEIVFNNSIKCLAGGNYNKS